MPTETLPLATQDIIIIAVIILIFAVIGFIWVLTKILGFLARLITGKGKKQQKGVLPPKSEETRKIEGSNLKNQHIQKKDKEERPRYSSSLKPQSKYKGLVDPLPSSF